MIQKYNELLQVPMETIERLVGKLLDGNERGRADVPLETASKAQRFGSKKLTRDSPMSENVFIIKSCDKEGTISNNAEMISSPSPFQFASNAASSGGSAGEGSIEEDLECCTLSSTSQSRSCNDFEPEIDLSKPPAFAYSIPDTARKEHDWRGNFEDSTESSDDELLVTNDKSEPDIDSSKPPNFLTPKASANRHQIVSSREKQLLTNYGDLNKASDNELLVAKNKMNDIFEKIRVMPGDEDYEYDKRIEFDEPDEDCSWD